MSIFDPGSELKLRPMRYPIFYALYKAAIKNTWFVEEIDFSKDIEDIHNKLTPAERHLLSRLVAFFATGDIIVQENVVVNLFKYFKAAEVRLYLGRQIYEEAVHVDFYLTLLDNYVPDMAEREAAFDAVKNIPAIKKKADFAFKWMNFLNGVDEVKTDEDIKKAMLNLASFGACNEGKFFFAAFAYVYFLRSKGLLNGLATGTNWVMRDESMHVVNAYEMFKVVRQEFPHLFDDSMKKAIIEMVKEAVDCEFAFAQDLLKGGIAGLPLSDMRQYLEYIADRRLELFGIEPIYGQSRQPFSFMELQDIQELTNFFERNVSSYQLGIKQEELKFDAEF